MSMARRIFFVVAALSVLSACSKDGELVTDFMIAPWVADPGRHIQAADWSKATTIDIRIRYDEFSPPLVRLKQNRPYVLRIINGDDTWRFFQAHDFFRTAAIDKLSVGKKDSAATCVNVLIIPEQETAELRLVPTRDGEYSFDSHFFFNALVPGFGFGGNIIVE